MKTETAELYSTYGPCGRESQIAELIISKLTPLADEVSADLLGNVIAVKKGVRGKTVMISCPLDRPGLAVLEAGEKYLRSDFVGNLSFENVHLQTAMFSDGAEFTVYNLGEDGQKLYETSVGIDVENAEDKAKYQKTAQFTMLKSEYKEDDEKIQGFGVGVTACCKILLDIMKNLNSEHTVALVFTVMSQLDDKAIGCALDAVKPDVWIELKTVKAKPFIVEAGKGPMVEIPMMRRRGDVSLIAQDEQLPVQFVMMKKAEKNPLYGFKRDYSGYAGLCSLGLPVTGLSSGDEFCLKSDMADTVEYIGRLLAGR